MESCIVQGNPTPQKNTRKLKLSLLFFFCSSIAFTRTKKKTTNIAFGAGGSVVG
jgi:hypothetical protein